MTRFALILPLVLVSLAAPVSSQEEGAETAAPLAIGITPQPRPEGLVERNQAAAVAAEEAAERARLAPAEPAQIEVADAQAPAASTGLAEASPAPEATPDTTADATPDRAAIAAQITSAIRACWNVSDLSPEATAVRIWLAFDTAPEGEVIRDTIEMTRFDNGTQDSAEEALMPAFAAIMRCGNDGLDLPVETHPIWQRVEILFDASSVVTR